MSVDLTFFCLFVCLLLLLSIDHHSILIGKCVGYNNQVAYLSFHVVSLLYYIVLEYLLVRCMVSYDDNIPLSPFVLFVYYYCIEHAFATTAAIICLGLIAITGLVLYGHVRCVLANTTAYEEVFWHRYSLLKSTGAEGKRVNPFNLGSRWANFKEFVGCGKGVRNWYTFYWNELLPENTNTYELAEKIVNSEDFDDTELAASMPVPDVNSNSILIQDPVV